MGRSNSKFWAPADEQDGAESFSSPPDNLDAWILPGTVSPARYCLGTSLFAGIPVPFQRMRLSNETLAYLQAAPFARAAEKNLRAMGLSKKIDYRSTLNHNYYEGYYHASGATFIDGKIQEEHSLHPRDGYDFAKPAAPKEFHVFCEAFRRANSAWLALLAKKFLDGQSKDISELMAQKMATGMAFADLAVQVHFGEEVAGEDLGWHIDSSNSLLHMAISVLGRRGLHSVQFPFKGEQFVKDAEDVLDWQEPGSVYVSCPWALRHAVEYPSCTYQHRVLAVQCRLLLTMTELFEVLGAEPETWPSLQQAVTATFREMSLTLPTFEQVQEVDAEYSHLR